MSIKSQLLKSGCFIMRTLSCSHAVLLLIALVSAFALAAAFISEAFLGLEPCKLCIYQRYPFALALFLSIIGFPFAAKKKLKPVIFLIALTAITFLINSLIAFYHTGVEQKWWISAVDGCLVPIQSNEPQSILENILSAPNARCDEIPWQDPIIGFSMANWNVILCLGMFGLLSLSTLLLLRKLETKQRTATE